VKEPDTVYASDITYIWTREGWLYLAVILDLFSRQVVGWSLSNRITKKLIMNALRMAIWRRRPAPGLIFHSDRGSQYCSNDFQKMLKTHGMISSMSRKGNCWDNAVAESFFATLEFELIEQQVFNTRKVAKTAIFEFIEVFYNRQRSHQTLDYKTPKQVEQEYPLVA
jgi:transposase InsO family protein